jgi:hypothetical protein
MTELQRPEPADLARLQMENELLGLEVGHLRARLKSSDELEQSAKSCREDLATTRRRLNELRKRHDLVLRDFQGLLQRLSASPAGPVLRRTKGFRVLLEKYGVGPPR